MIDIKEYLKNAQDLSESELLAARITAQELIEIYYDYLETLKVLEIEGAYLSNRLQFFKNINSVRWRTKDPIHLLTKIVRKRKEAIEKDNNSSKYLSINVNNYKEVITDLLGLRAIYLFKFQWKLVDSYICNNFKIIPDEIITIYHAPEDDLAFYYEDGYEKKLGEVNLKYSRVKRDSKYRSTHYIAETNFPHNFKLEIQIRSILDEAWGEIDHYIRYPNHQDDEELKRQMTVLNGAINGCEELSTTYIEKFRSKNLQAAQEIFSDKQEFFESSEEDKTTVDEEVTVDKSLENSQKILQNLAVESDLSRLTTASGIPTDGFTGLSALHLAAGTGNTHSALRAARIAAASAILPDDFTGLSALHLAAGTGNTHSSLRAARLSAASAILPEAYKGLNAVRLAAETAILPKTYPDSPADSLTKEEVRSMKEIPAEKKENPLSAVKEDNS
ncbi:RelA/SpoT domain-containing protein [Acinetobacter pittii]|uniref:RelA/SpoT domain-containing protein n=1 Tax=Acinetobacter pittii TaxID=48296 RepID=UPI00083CDD94|nr:RelA/SpoT domain-containing protein [Acinetobacter pittii]MCK0913915.1 RelA/SpoT domain-containing protein [Acinetobacter pittii]